MSFLSQAFQSQSANNTTSIVSAENSTKLPLGGQNSFFQGTFVPSSNYSVVQLSCLSDTLVEIVVESSFDGIAFTVTEAFFNTQEDIDATRAAPFYGFITLPFVRILITNIDTITNTVFEFCTKLTSTSPPANQIDPAPVIIIGTAQVQDLPLENIAGVLATKPVGAMTINDWYRVASPGGTSGAVWAEIGAYIVPGESAPRVGTLFQCIYVYGDSSPTAGKVWDVQYNTWEADNLVVASDNLQVVEENSGDILNAVNSIDGKITICNTSDVTITGALPEGTNSIGYVRNTAYNVSAESWQAIQIDAGDVKVVEKNSGDILTAVNSIDSKIVTCDTGAVVVASGNITVDNFPATQPISGTVEVSSIIGALPEGTNSIGYVRNTAYNVSAESWQAIQIDAGDVKMVEKNSGDILTAVNSIDGKIIACDTAAVVVASGNINIDNFPATQPISGSVTISGTAQVQDLPLENIAGINAPRPVYNMVVGNWYRVANPGNTSGAVWIEIGAPLFVGASIPNVGVLFKCLYVYLNFSTTGTVWDEPYNTWEENNLVVTAGDLQVVEKNSGDILTAVNSIDSKIIGCNTDAVIVASGDITETNSSAIAASVASIDGKIVGCNTDAVIVASGNITETNSAAIAASVASIDGKIVGCNTDAVIVASGNITETNSAAIAASVASIDGKIVGCNTDAVIVASGDITETNSAAIDASLVSIDSKLISCNTDTVTITTSLPSGSATIGAVNLRAYSNVVPGEVALNAIPNADNNECLCVSDLAATNIEINANKTSYVENLTPQIYPAGNGLTIDMDTNENRMRNITVLLKVNTTTYTNPSVMIGYSEDEINFFFDGNFASFYDLGGNVKSCVLQRTQVPTRFARVYFNTDTEIILGIITTQKS